MIFFISFHIFKRAFLAEFILKLADNNRQNKKPANFNKFILAQMESALNDLSTQTLGYQLFKRDAENITLIVPIGKYIIGGTVSSLCLLVYLLAATLFQIFSKTYR
jgi:hypothetical protein